ncbi:hypothetical protein TOPH_04077 [Tolypocladium ophioglossoides CBS 100239]|uniref:Uncharacterized protein n=1 Tax=Tolypocladium ophioglossoides (strain CBS 100239) TaxID=1163406 RepID=A0A0L0NBE6_TOLOC|nr:hypothetical protein TOPH_04077 [Tolypocladium ophioglossoides CBS 100239]
MMHPMSDSPAPWINGKRPVGNASYTTNGFDPAPAATANPFTASDDEDEFPLEEFCRHDAATPRSIAGFVSEHPSRHLKRGDSDLASHMSSVQQVEDKAVSEWETVAADEEFDIPAEPIPMPKSQPTSAQATLRAPRIFSYPSHYEPSVQRPNTLSVWPTEPHDHLRCNAATKEQLHLSSSIYSYVSNDEWISEELADHFDCRGLERNQSRKRPATLGLDRNMSGELVRSHSKTSSSLSVDRFKYDRGLYPIFLQPSAERQISKALHRAGMSADSGTTITQSLERVKLDPDGVPVIRDATHASTNNEVASHDGDAHTLAQTHTDRETDGDWQTVTTERRHEPIREIEINFVTGSSLADMSDIPDDEIPRGAYSSTERVVQNSYRLKDVASTRAGHDKLNIRGKLGQVWTKHGTKANHPDQPIKMNQLPARAAAAIRRFSNPFHHDITASQWEKPKPAFELQNLSNSYESLDSEPVEQRLSHQQRQEDKFRWSRIQQKLGRDPPRIPMTILDKPLYIKNARGSGSSDHVPHDKFLSDIPLLPFPLISLPEAAMLQYFRRERGEEDHTDAPSSFAAKARSARSGTVSTISTTTSPLTPLSPLGDLHTSFAGTTHPKPLAVYQSRFLRRQRSLSVDTTPSRLRSSAILGSSPSIASRHRSGGPWYDVGLRESPSTLGAKILRLRGFSSSTRQRRANTTAGSIELFSRSETHLIESARESILLHRHLSDDEGDRQKFIFVNIMVVTIIFPLIGVLALYGRFDSTISWCSHGEMHSLTKEQRSILKQQLFVEAVFYPVLITILSVYYSVHG